MRAWIFRHRLQLEAIYGAARRPRSPVTMPDPRDPSRRLVLFELRPPLPRRRAVDPRLPRSA